MASHCVLLAQVVCCLQALQSWGAKSLLLQEKLQRQDKLVQEELFKHFFGLPLFLFSGSLVTRFSAPCEPALCWGLALPLQWLTLGR